MLAIQLLQGISDLWGPMWDSMSLRLNHTFPATAQSIIGRSRVLINRRVHYEVIIYRWTLQFSRLQSFCNFILSFL